MKNKTFLLVLFAAFSLTMSAQITGTVLEASTDFPVIGASVVEVGTTNGVITDFDGNFVLNVAEGAQIQISYMGFAAQTLAAKDGMIVKLEEDTHVLQEVVAIGYGSQKKKEVTGSVASVKAEDFNAGVKSNPVGLLQGKVAGLNIINNSSDPTSGGYSIQIRGFSTLDKGAGSSPLYIVDGIPVNNIDNIAPEEIASMDVLKDGSAAAIYGTRGTNGVILITTKRGEGFSDTPQTQVEYSGYVSTAWVNAGTGMGSQLKLSSILSSTIFILIIYFVLKYRAPSGNSSSHEPKSILLCTIGDYSFGIFLVHMMFLKGLQDLEFYSAIPYPLTSLIVLSVSFIFCYACTAVMGKRAGRWLGYI